MTAHASDDQHAGQAAETAGEDEEPSSRSRVVALFVVGLVVACRIVVAYPEVAYVIVGVLGTLGSQRFTAWREGRHDDEESDEEAEQPDIGEALRRLIGDDKGVLLTVLRDDLKLPDTKDVKSLLKAEGIPWKAGRTREGNGPSVRRDAIPPAPTPPAADAHRDGCCCRSGNNGNGNNADGEGIRVQAIGDSGHLVPHHPALESLVDRFFAEAEKERKREAGRGEVSDQ